MGEGLGRHLIAYLDTHVVAMLAQGERKRLTRAAQRALVHYDLRLSPMALLELEYLFEIRRIKISANDVLSKLGQELFLEISDLPFELIVQMALHESWTRDPFDRIIVAQAKANGLAYLISSDENIAAHYPRTVW